MIINLTQMRIWEMNPHLPKPTPNTLPAGFLCAGMPTGTHRETGFPNRDAASPPLRAGDSFPSAMPTSRTRTPSGHEKGHLPCSHTFGLYSTSALGKLLTYCSG